MSTMRKMSVMLGLVGEGWAIRETSLRKGKGAGSLID